MFLSLVLSSLWAEMFVLSSLCSQARGETLMCQSCSEKCLSECVQIPSPPCVYFSIQPLLPLSLWVASCLLKSHVAELANLIFAGYYHHPEPEHCICSPDLIKAFGTFLSFLFQQLAWVNTLRCKSYMHFTTSGLSSHRMCDSLNYEYTF